MDPLIEYVFGPGDGMLSRWSSPADLDLDSDGTPDAVAVDFDGDGRADDALWDVDGDGRADIAALDVDDDGRPERLYRDSGRGLWDIAVADDDVAGKRGVGGAKAEAERDEGAGDAERNEPGAGDGGPPAGGEQPQSRESSESSRSPDPPRAGRQPSPQRLDLDGDGRVDAEVIGSGKQRRLYIDQDGDGAFDTVLVDSDGDGTADAVYGAEAPEFGR